MTTYDLEHAHYSDISCSVEICITDQQGIQMVSVSGCGMVQILDTIYNPDHFVGFLNTIELKMASVFGKCSEYLPFGMPSVTVPIFK